MASCTPQLLCPWGMCMLYPLAVWAPVPVWKFGEKKNAVSYTMIWLYCDLGG